jgi:hypothetical protein
MKVVIGLDMEIDLGHWIKPRQEEKHTFEDIRSQPLDLSERE